MQMNSQVEFDLIYSQAESLLKTFPEYQFKSASALIIVIGWLVTADTAQHFIHVNAVIAMPATVVAFSILLFFEILWAHIHAGKIRLCYVRLKRLANQHSIPEQSIDLFNVSNLLTYTYHLINVLMCSAVIVVVWLICRP